MWMIVFILCWVVRIKAACDLQVTTKLKVTKYSGESVLLPCSCTHLQAEPQGVRWWKGQRQIDPTKPADKIQMTNQDSPGNLSLLISDLTKEDEGQYRCEGHQYSYRDFTLTVTGCTLMEQLITLQIKRNSGESALLPCLCSSLRAKPESVRWMTTSRSGSMDTEISNTTGPYRGRVQMLNRHSPGNVSLLISDLSEKDQGTYICIVDTHSTKYVNLLVKANTSTTKSSPGKKTPAIKEKDSRSNGETKPPFYIFIIAAVLLLLLLLGGAIFLYMRHKGQKGKCTKSGQRHEEDQDDTRVYCTVQDTIEDRSTQAEEEDDVTYSTVVHDKKPRVVQVEMDTGDDTEYAKIKTR
ncbi:uncharacterized protein LOC116220482 [Clupea harengus]|uniref:Uncharacterized protein LOC116220482 n=1 Tax=Clupea harengus TaxID=7950 RepID=A0A6P8FHM1_CLUHA|nr:uncharacterized protein LOC116220482 [Clupea harengus]